MRKLWNMHMDGVSLLSDKISLYLELEPEVDIFLARSMGQSYLTL